MRRRSDESYWPIAELDSKASDTSLANNSFVNRDSRFTNELFADLSGVQTRGTFSGVHIYESMSSLCVTLDSSCVYIHVYVTSLSTWTRTAELYLAWFMTRAATAAADAASGGNKTSHHSSSSHVAPVSGLQVRTLEVTDSSQCSFCLGHRYMAAYLYSPAARSPRIHSCTPRRAAELYHRPISWCIFAFTGLC